MEHEWIEFFGHTTPIGNDQIVLTDGHGASFTAETTDVRIDGTGSTTRIQIRRSALVTVGLDPQGHTRFDLPSEIVCIGGVYITRDRGSVVGGCDDGPHCPLLQAPDPVPD